MDGGHERASSYDSNDHQLTVDWQGGHGGTSGDAASFTSAVTLSAEGYTVEYRVPWTALASPTAGDVLGFDIAVNDNDGADTTRDRAAHLDG